MYKTLLSAWNLRRCFTFIVLLAWIGDPASAQQRVDPAVRARLDREFAEAHPQPGDYLPNLELQKLKRRGSKRQSDDEPSTGSLRYASHGELTLVLTASLTCPKTRQHLPAIQQLEAKYKKQLGITIIYVVEAHPEKDVCPYLGVVDVTEANLRDNILYRQPKSMEERITIAGEFQKRYPIDGEILIDSMDNVAWRSLGQSPNMALLIDSDHRVLLRQGWVEPKSLEEAIVKHVVEPRDQETGTDGVPGSYGSGFGGPGSSNWFQSDAEETNPELMIILNRLSPDYPNHWEFVRWLEKVDSEKLRLLLRRFPSIINERLIYGPHFSRETTILQIMIERDDIEKVKIACEASANVNLATRTYTPLCAAVSANNFAMVDYLILNGADVRKCPPGQGDNLLRFAAWKSRKQIAQRLVDAGLEHDIFTESGLGMVDALTKRLDATPNVGLSFDATGNLPFTYAVSGNQVEIVKLLLDRNLAITPGHHPKGDPLVLAVQHEETTMLETLLQNGFSPNHLALDNALRADRYKHFRLLMTEEADLNFSRKGRYPLHLAISRRLPLSFAEDLLAHGEDINKLTIVFHDEGGCGPGPGPKGPQPTRETPLHIAARTLSPEYVRFLLSNKAKNAELDQSELTPLVAAILETLSTSETGSARGLETIKELIKGGCPKDAKDTKGHKIVDEIDKIIRQDILNETKEKTRPNDEHRRFRIQEHDELVGLDATKLAPSPLLKKILECLK